MESLVINSIKEICLYDVIEMLFLLLFYLNEANKKISKIQFSYILGIMTILDYIVSALNLPLIMQVIFTLILGIYLKGFFKITIKTNVIIIVKWFIFMLIDVVYVILFNSIFHIQLLALSNNDLLKFYYSAPCKIVEFSIIYLYYYKGGRFFMKKNKKISWLGSIKKRNL